MKAGPELDALICHKILRWRWFDVVGIAVLVPPWLAKHFDEQFVHKGIDGPGERDREFLDGRWFGGGRLWLVEPLKVSADWNAMKEVVEAVTEETFDMQIDVFSPDYYRVTIGSQNIVEEGDSLPYVVCLAVLKVDLPNSGGE